MTQTLSKAHLILLRLFFIPRSINKTPQTYSTVAKFGFYQLNFAFSSKIFFQPGTQIQILVLDLDRRYGNNANQNLGITVIIIQNNKDIELLQHVME